MHATPRTQLYQQSLASCQAPGKALQAKLDTISAPLSGPRNGSLRANVCFLLPPAWLGRTQRVFRGSAIGGRTEASTSECFPNKAACRECSCCVVCGARKRSRGTRLSPGRALHIYIYIYMYIYIYNLSIFIFIFIFIYLYIYIFIYLYIYIFIYLYIYIFIYLYIYIFIYLYIYIFIYLYLC